MRQVKKEYYSSDLFFRFISVQDFFCNTYRFCPADDYIVIHFMRMWISPSSEDIPAEDPTSATSLLSNSKFFRHIQLIFFLFQCIPK